MHVPMTDRCCPKQGALSLRCPRASSLAVRGARAQVSTVLTEVVCVAQVEDVAAVHVVVEGLLDQVLWLVPGQLGHPG